MAYDEVVVLACTSLVFLCFVRARKVWVKDYLKKTRDFWMLQLFANVRLSESQSDLVNYMRIDIKMLEELFSLVETQISKNRYHARHHILVFIFFRSQIRLTSQHT